MLKYKNQMLAVLLSALLVSACSRVVTQNHLKDAEAVCKDKGEIYELKVIDTGEVFVYCKDGSNERV